MQNQSKHDIIRPLTGVRGLTIIWVVLYHFSAGISVLAPALWPVMVLSQRVTFRVDLLFMLSGFLLAYVYIERHEKFDFKVYRKFLWARLSRFYPPYFAAEVFLILAVCIGQLSNFPIPSNYSLKVLPFRFTLLQAWPFLSWTTWSWNFPTWFMSALFFAYLFAFPCVWKLFPKLRASRFAVLWVFAPILVCMVVCGFAVLRQFHAVSRACFGMLSGSALCTLYVERRPIVAAAQEHLDKIVLFFLGCFVLLLWMSSSLVNQVINDLLLLTCPLLLAGLTAERSLTARLFATRPFMWVGKISYSLYVTHAVVLIPLRGLLPPQRFAGSPLFLRSALLALYVFCILIFAVAMYKLVEVPCAEALKRLSARRRLTSLGKIAPASGREILDVDRSARAAQVLVDS